LEHLFDYGLFLAQAVTVVAAILIVIGGVVALSQKQKAEHEGHIEIKNLNEKYDHIKECIDEVVSDEDALKAAAKERKKTDKKTAKETKKKRKSGDEDAGGRARLYVLDFDGDIRASATDNLREEISAVLPHIRKGDEVLLRLESPGGMVHGYGLAASQLKRIVDAKVPLTIAVDMVAASGGYMMACVADRIIAAPFAVLGSIGVIAQLPNFHRLLKKHDVDFEMITAGEYKRTLTMFGENTDKGREKFAEEIEDTHVLFKEFVGANRPDLDVAKVATGEVWYGQRAIEVGLVDAVQTSDAYLQDKISDTDVYEVKFVHKKNWQEKVGLATEGALEKVFLKIWNQAQQRKNY
jgi:serine protease SohB